MVAPDDVEQPVSARYALETTLSDAPHEYVGMAGQCLAESCECKFFSGECGECADCRHANLMHLVRPHREDVIAREAEIARSKQLFTKRAAREAREREKRAAEELAKPIPVIINTFPCSIDECECAKFTAPSMPNIGEDGAISDANLPSPSAASTARLTISTNELPSINQSMNSARASLNSPGGSTTSTLASLLLPKVCRKCKHAEMYHIKSDDDGKKKAKGAKSPKKKK